MRPKSADLSVSAPGSLQHGACSIKESIIPTTYGFKTTMTAIKHTTDNPHIQMDMKFNIILET